MELHVDSGMSLPLASGRREYIGAIIGLSKGDARSLDYGSLRRLVSATSFPTSSTRKFQPGDSLKIELTFVWYVLDSANGTAE